MPRQMDDWIKTNEPCVYQHKTETRYMVIVRATTPKTGKRVKRTRSDPTMRTMEQAIIAREAIKLEIRGEQVARPSKPTLSSYSLEWIARREQWLAHGTARMYRKVLKHKILPVLGDIYCESIERRDVEDWVAWCERQTRRGQPYAQATMRSWRRVLTPLLKDLAIDYGIPDPTVRVRQAKSSRRRVREIQTLTVRQLGKLLEAVRTDERRAQRYAELVTLAYTGMRSGELWALHWEDVERAAIEGIHIHRSISEGVIRDETKTGWERHAYAPEIVLEAITEHRQNMIRKQHRGLSSGLVFPSNEGTPRSSGSLRKVLDGAAESAGIEQRVSPQVFRRTFNSRMAESAVQDLVLRSQIGHSSSEMTRHYFDGHLEAKARAYEQVFGVGGHT